MFFARGKKAVQGQSVFPNVRVNQQRNLGVEIAKCGKCRERDGYQIADAADIENDLIGSFFKQSAAKESNH